MTHLSIIATTAILAAGAFQPTGFEPATMTIPASSLLEEDMLKGDRYTIAETVTVEGYMHHYAVESEFGQFTAVGDRALTKLLHEIDAIAELMEVKSGSAGKDAVVGAVVETGQSLANLAIHPVKSVKGISAGVARFFKRTSRKAKKVGSKVSERVRRDDNKGAKESGEEADEPGLTTQLTYSYLGISRAQRKLARELNVDPYSDNEVLQAELSRVARIAGPVRKITRILMPIPSFVGISANVSELVWRLSTTDLLIMNEEKLESLGYEDEEIKAFFENRVFSPTEQTALVAALESLDKVKGREVLLSIAISAESQTEGEFVVRLALVTQVYHKNIEPVTELAAIPDGLVPVAITERGNGLIITPLDHLLWTREIASATEKLGKLIGDQNSTGKNLMWVEGRVSDRALTRLGANDWVTSGEDFQDLEAMITE